MVSNSLFQFFYVPAKLLSHYFNLRLNHHRKPSIFLLDKLVVVLLILQMSLSITLAPTAPKLRAILQPDAINPTIPGLKQTSSSALSGQVPQQLARTPLSFEENQGQLDPAVRYFSRGIGYNLYLTGNEAIFTFQKSPLPGSSTVENYSHDNPLPARLASGTIQTAPPVTVRMQLEGATGLSSATGLAELPAKTNYFIGNDPKDWRQSVSNYGQVKFSAVYPGIDLVYYGNGQQLEYDFVVGAGVDPGQINLAFAGADELSLGPKGALVLKAGGLNFQLAAPVIYQEQNGQRTIIEGHYTLKPALKADEKPQIGFEIGNYNPELPLVIDPTLIYSTYFGGTDGDYGFGVAVDSSGNTYITGSTSSTDFPTKTPYQGSLSGYVDAFISKFDPNGALLYSTYFGGSDTDHAERVAADSSGNAYVTGNTLSTDFPALGGAQKGFGGYYDAFVSKFNSTGTLVLSGILGGANGDFGNDIAVDTSGNFLVVGETFSTDFPTHIAYQNGRAGSTSTSYADAFVTKYNSSGALVYSTYFGGSVSDIGRGIGIDANGNAWITGDTESTDFPTKTPYQAASGGSTDSFVAKFDPNGGLLYSSYLGGSGYEEGKDLAVDTAGDALLTGETDSTDFPTKSAYQSALADTQGSSDAYIVKFNPNGGLVYSSYFGGNNTEIGNGIATDGNNNVFITGTTGSTNLPIKSAFQASLAGGQGDTDSFVASFNSDGGLLYSSYLGGGDDDEAQSVAATTAGIAYVSGTTASSNFPTKTPIQGSLAGGQYDHDVFLTKISAPSINHEVTVAVDNGDPGTLSYLLANVTNGDTITFASGITIITFTTGHAALHALNTGVTLQGICGTGGPQITIDGTGMSGNGLTLSSNNFVSGVIIKRFGGKQLVANSGDSQLKCSRFSKN